MKSEYKKEYCIIFENENQTVSTLISDKIELQGNFVIFFTDTNRYMIPYNRIYKIKLKRKL